jgi:DNA-binding response OmpR family regulator
MVGSRPARASILTVEPDPTTARVLIDALEMVDYRVWHATDGREARALAERARPDLILLDLVLPDIDGLVLCSVLKAATDAPIIICSATSRRGDPVLALKLGADDFVRKPFEVDDLLARIEAILRRRPPAVSRGSGEIAAAFMSTRPAEVRLGDLPTPP